MTPRSGDAVPAPFTRKSRYILVIENDTNDLFFTAMLLNRFSYPVCTARNARQALDMVSVAMPALVVTDVSFPGMSGIDLLRVLGSNPHTFSIPVILMLPPGGATRDRADIEIGGHTVLQKPVAVEDLFRAVQAVMEPTPRTNIRVATMLPVVLNKVALDQSRGECATHLSALGMYIRTFKYHSRDEKIALEFTVGGRIIRADATILYACRQDERPFSEPGIAVKFTRLTAEDREVIKRYVHDEILRGIVTEGTHTPPAAP